LLAAFWAVPLAGQGAPPGPRDIAFRAQCDGTEQRYALLLPSPFDPARPHDLLIALHGHGSDRWQFMRPTRDETRAVLDVAARHALILVTPDYRAGTSWMGPKAEADVTQIVGELKTQYRSRKVLLCGGSMGGSSALRCLAPGSNRRLGIHERNRQLPGVREFSGCDPFLIWRDQAADPARVQTP
jgi:pimeloyl-ACP methyl ester carboxylesterase